MGRLLKSQPIRINRNFSNDNIPCEILSSFVVGLTSFDVTHTREPMWAPTNGDNGGLEIIENILRVTTKNGNDR